ILVGGFGVLWQLGLAPGSRVTLPAPVALSRPTPDPAPAAEPTALAGSLLAPTPAPAPVAPAPVAPAPTLVPAPVHLGPLPPAPDALDRHLAAERPPPGYAVRLAIPSIKLETDV